MYFLCGHDSRKANRTGSSYRGHNRASIGASACAIPSLTREGITEREIVLCKKVKSWKRSVFSSEKAACVFAEQIEIFGKPSDSHSGRRMTDEPSKLERRGVPFLNNRAGNQSRSWCRGFCVRRKENDDTNRVIGGILKRQLCAPPTCGLPRD